MPTIIDALLVTLGLDDAQFQKARKRADKDWADTADNAQKSGKEQEEAARKAALAMSQLRGEVVSLGLAFLGARSIKDFVANTVAMTAAVGRSSQVMGADSNVLNSWGDAIKNAGGNAQEAIGLFGRLTDMRADFVRHPERFAQNPAFRQLFGGNMGSVRGMFQQGPETVLLHLADQYQAEMAKARASGRPGAEGDTQATFRQRAQELLGISDETLRLIERGRPALEQQLAYYREHDRLLRSDADAAEEFQRQFGRVSTQLTGVARTVLTPTLGFLADTMDKLSGSSEPAGQNLRNVALGFVALMHPLDAILQTLANKGLISQNTADALESKTFQDVRAWASQNPGGAPPPAGGAPNYAPGYAGRPGTAYGGNPGRGMVRGSGGGVGNSADGAATIQRFFQQNGYSAEQARGIAAGIAAEGGSLGMAANGAFGIGQWRGARLARLRAQYGTAPSFQQQLQFLNQELRGGDPGGAAVRFQRTAEGTATAYIQRFMRPQGKWNAMLGRFDHQADLNADLQRTRNFLRTHPPGSVSSGPTSVTVHVDARGATSPHKVAQQTGHAVKKALHRTHVANANGGLN